jgi:hypothetical protein
VLKYVPDLLFYISLSNNQNRTTFKATSQTDFVSNLLLEFLPKDIFY